MFNAEIADAIQKIANLVIRQMNARIVHWKSAVAGQVRACTFRINKMRNIQFGSFCVFPSLDVHLPLQAHRILRYNLRTKWCIFSY
jgi:hypothetical protein